MAPRWFEQFLGPVTSESKSLLSNSTLPHRFRDLRTAHPHWTESQLLNSNNRVPYNPTADVVVGGAGILGLAYAIHLKSIMPHLDIAVFEKSSSPQHKIGESTLSSFTRFLNTDVVGTDYLLRLFGVKDGLDFIWVDETGSRPIHQDIGNLDVSLQLDRRMSELFLTMWAQKIGVRVYHGVGVDYEVEIPTDINAAPTDSIVRTITLKDTGRSLGVVKGDEPVVESTISARYVCDASGFGCRLTSQLGQRELFDGWNTDAVWAYFKPLKYTPPDSQEDELVEWDYAATKHICFPEGWGWFIKLISWHKAPLANLLDLLTHFIDLAIQRTPMEEMPSTMELSKQFDCPYEFITSIGWAVRDDTPKSESIDATPDLPRGESERRFLAIQKKYPVLDRLMTQRYELLPGYYHNRTYFTMKHMSFQRPVVAGVNWFAIGNATGFTNPLISPGINAGLVGAIKSAEMTVSCLQVSLHSDPAYVTKVHKDIRNEYQHFIHDYAIPRLHRMNRFWYNSFRDGRLFEATIICFWAIGSDNRSYLSHRLNPRDFEWLVGAGSDAFATFCEEILPLIEGPCDGNPVDDHTVDQVRTVCRRWLDECVRMYPQPWASNQRHYNDQLVRIETKNSRVKGFFYLHQCPTCSYWNTPTLPACQICGHKKSVDQSI